MKRLSLCLIVKADDDEAEILNRCLSYVAKYVDAIYITVTGKEGEAKEVEGVVKSFNGIISYFDWINDFAAARNFNFSQSKEDYIFWLDSDDIVKGAENLKKAVLAMEEKNVDVVTLDYFYHFDEYGMCDVKHRKSRIVKNDGCTKWYGEIHEDLLSERTVNNYFEESIQVFHLQDDRKRESKNIRNLEIALSVLGKRPEDATAYWNVANAQSVVGNYKESIETYKKFIEKSGSEDEIALAHLRMSNCYMDLNDVESAKSEASQVIIMRPWFPDGYLLLGDIYFKLNKPRYAKELLVTGLGKEMRPDEYIVWNPRDYDFNPLMMLSQCYVELGKPEEARKCLGECQKIYPKNDKINKMIEAVDKEIEKLRKVDEIVEKVKKIKGKKEIKDLLDTIPDELKSHPKLAVIRNTYFIKKESTGKDLAIFCYATAEPFNPDLIMKRGTGGSEEAVYQISKKMAKLGWNVTVYADCGIKEQVFEGVMWKPYWEFNLRDKWDALVFWRHPMYVDYKELASDNVYVWLHDVLRESEFTNIRLKNIKKIIALSKYQRNLFPKVPDDKFFISGNGIDVELFKSKRGKVERDQGRLIWTSSYDRGLKTLLKLFPKVKEKVPFANLHIFYGWNTWDIMYKDDPVKKKERQEIEELMKQDGVTHHGRVSQEQIVGEYFKSSILAYPTEFTEISYISGMKSQAAGCIPVTTGIYAIDETIQYGVKVKGNKIYSDQDAQSSWVDAVVHLLKNPTPEEERYKISEWACKTFDWNNIAKQWDRVLKIKK